MVALKQYLKAIQAFRAIITLDSAAIEPVEFVCDLGAIFDRHMSMILQVNTICKSMYCHLRQIGEMQRHLTKVSRATIALIVQSLLVSPLDCSNILLYGLPSSHPNRPRVAQNNAARVMKEITSALHYSTPVAQLACS